MPIALVISDDPDFHRATKPVFQERGYFVLGAKDWREAKAAFGVERGLRSVEMIVSYEWDKRKIEPQLCVTVRGNKQIYAGCGNRPYDAAIAHLRAAFST